MSDKSSKTYSIPNLYNTSGTLTINYNPYTLPSNTINIQNNYWNVATTNTCTATYNPASFPTSSNYITVNIASGIYNNYGAGNYSVKWELNTYNYLELFNTSEPYYIELINFGGYEKYLGAILDYIRYYAKTTEKSAAELVEYIKDEDFKILCRRLIKLDSFE